MNELGARLFVPNRVGRCFKHIEFSFKNFPVGSSMIGAALLASSLSVKESWFLAITANIYRRYSEKSLPLSLKIVGKKWNTDRGKSHREHLKATAGRVRLGRLVRTTTTAAATWLISIVVF